MSKELKHSLNASVDKRTYLEYRFVMKEQKRSINAGTELVIRAYVDNWKRENNKEILDSDLES